MPNNRPKEEEGTVFTIYEIEIDIVNLIICLPLKKLGKVWKAILNALALISINLLDIWSLIKYLSFYTKIVCLSRVFIKKLQDFLKAYLSHLSQTAKCSIPTKIWKDLL